MKQLNPLISLMLNNNQKIKVAPLNQVKKLQEEALKLICKIFTTSEPVTTGVKATEEEFYISIKEVFQYSLKHSSIAYTPHDNKIYGVMLSSDLYLEKFMSEEDLNQVPKSMQNLFSLGDICSQKLYQKKQINMKTLAENQVLCQMMIAVQPEASGMNIGVNLLQHNVQLAKNNKFRMVKIECSSKRSASLALKLDYEVIDEVFYQDISVGNENKNYWKDIPEKFNEEKITVLYKEMNGFNNEKYNFNQSNLFQFQF